MPALSKTKTILQRVNLPGPPTFHQGEDAGQRGHFVTLDEEVFADMGQPEVITVTIEPGDLLNDGSDL